MQGTSPPTIFSKRRRATRAARAVIRQSKPDAARFVLDEIMEDILERLAFMRFEPAKALVIGDVSGSLGKSLEGSGVAVTSLLPEQIDEEQPLTHSNYDLIVNIASLDTVNDLPGALIHIRGALADGGLFIGAIPSAGSLPVLRTVMLAADGERPAARIHPMVDAKSGAALMQRAGFSRQVADSFTVKASYTSLSRLVSDVRDQGLGSALKSVAPAIGKAGYQLAQTAFEGQADTNGRVTESFEILLLTGWKSQT